MARPLRRRKEGVGRRRIVAFQISKSKSASKAMRYSELWKGLERAEEAPDSQSQSCTLKQ